MKMLFHFLINFHAFEFLICQDRYEQFNLNLNTKMPDLADLLTLPSLCNYGKTRMKIISKIFLFFRMKISSKIIVLQMTIDKSCFAIDL